MTLPWWNRSEATAIVPEPWLHIAVVDYLARLLSPGDTVIEHGSGGSTLWLAARVAKVISVEHDPDWYQVILPRLPQNVTLHLDITGDIPANLPRADLLLIDGEPIESRAQWILCAPALVRPGGIVVLDNANRPEYADERVSLTLKARQHITFDVNAHGTRHLYTVFYLMPGGDRAWI